MKAFKPLVGGCILGLCSVAFAAQAQTTAPAVPGASGTTSPSTVTPGPTSPDSPAPGTSADPSAAHPSGTTNSTPMNRDRTDEMKKCDALTGTAKDTCMEQAKTKHDNNTSGAMNNNTNSGATSMENQKK